MEVQRICNIAPITAAHRAKSDTKVSGYNYSKGNEKMLFFSFIFIVSRFFMLL